MSNIRTLESLKAAFAKTENTQEREPFQNNFYPFWNMKQDEQCKVRFLPDTNTENPFGFQVIKSFHTLEINGEKKSIPCIHDLFGEDCPICKVSQEFYKAEGKESPNGKKFWKKKQYITQALIVEDPLPADPKTGETHKGQLRYITLSYQLQNVIQEAFKADDVLTDIPYLFEGGHDFIIKKTKSGTYDAYNIGSRFVPKQRSLTDDELAIVEEFSIDLSTLLPKHPGREKVEAMLEAALTGGNYSDDNSPVATEVKQTRPTKAVSKVQVSNDDDDRSEIESHFEKPSISKKSTPIVEQSTPEVDSSVENMLATIRQRRQAQQKTAE